MTDDEGRVTPREASKEASSSIRATATVRSTEITSSQAQEQQTASIFLTEQELRAYLEISRRQENRAHRQHERRKDWVLFCVVIGALVGGLLLGVALILGPTDDEMKRRGENLLLLILGTLGGYFVGSRTKQ